MNLFKPGDKVRFIKHFREHLNAELDYNKIYTVDYILCNVWCILLETELEYGYHTKSLAFAINSLDMYE